MSIRSTGLCQPRNSMSEKHLWRDLDALVSCLGILMPFLARGVPIYQLQLGGSRNVLGYDPIGQSFTAEDPQVSIGVHLRAASHMVPTGNEFRFDLLAGEDING